jgi:hypothetical protein
MWDPEILLQIARFIRQLAFVFMFSEKLFFLGFRYSCINTDARFFFYLEALQTPRIMRKKNTNKTPITKEPSRKPAKISTDGASLVIFRRKRGRTIRNISNFASTRSRS